MLRLPQSSEFPPDLRTLLGGPASSHLIRVAAAMEFRSTGGSGPKSCRFFIHFLLPFRPLISSRLLSRALSAWPTQSGPSEHSRFRPARARCLSLAGAPFLFLSRGPQAPGLPSEWKWELRGSSPKANGGASLKKVALLFWDETRRQKWRRCCCCCWRAAK